MTTTCRVLALALVAVAVASAVRIDGSAAPNTIDAGESAFDAAWKELLKEKTQGTVDIGSTDGNNQELNEEPDAPPASAKMSPPSTAGGGSPPSALLRGKLLAASSADGGEAAVTNEEGDDAEEVANAFDIHRSTDPASHHHGRDHDGHSEHAGHGGEEYGASKHSEHDVEHAKDNAEHSAEHEHAEEPSEHKGHAAAEHGEHSEPEHDSGKKEVAAEGEASNEKPAEGVVEHQKGSSEDKQAVAAVPAAAAAAEVNNEKLVKEAESAERVKEEGDGATADVKPEDPIQHQGAAVAVHDKAGNSTLVNGNVTVVGNVTLVTGSEVNGTVVGVNNTAVAVATKGKKESSEDENGKDKEKTEGDVGSKEKEGEHKESDKKDKDKPEKNEPEKEEAKEEGEKEKSQPEKEEPTGKTEEGTEKKDEGEKEEGEYSKEKEEEIKEKRKKEEESSFETAKDEKDRQLSDAKGRKQAEEDQKKSMSEAKTKDEEEEARLKKENDESEEAAEGELEKKKEEFEKKEEEVEMEKEAAAKEKETIVAQEKNEEKQLAQERATADANNKASTNGTSEATNSTSDATSNADADSKSKAAEGASKAEGQPSSSDDDLGAVTSTAAGDSNESSRVAPQGNAGSGNGTETAGERDAFEAEAKKEEEAAAKKPAEATNLEQATNHDEDKLDDAASEEDSETGDHDYFILLDAGSVRTKLTISMKYHKPPGDPDAHSKVVLMKLDPEKYVTTTNKPVTDFIDNLDALGDNLMPLLDSAQNAVPAAKRSTTDISVVLTGLIHQYSRAKISMLLDEIRSVVSTMPFSFHYGHVRMLPSADKGAMTWVSLNQGLGNLVEGRKTVGVASLGGEEVTVAYIPDSSALPLTSDEGGFNVTLSGVKSELFAYGYRGLGMESSEAFYYESLANSDSVEESGMIELDEDSTGASMTQKTSPCLLLGDTRVVGEGAETVEVTAGVMREGIATLGGDFALCYEHIKTMVMNGARDVNNYGSKEKVSLESEPKPPSALGKSGDFYIVRGFFYISRFFDMVGTNKVKDYKDKGDEYCSLSLVTAEKEYAEVLQQYYGFFPEEQQKYYIRSYCYGMALTYALLKDVYLLEDDDEVIVADSAGGHTIDWPSGIVHWYASQEDESQATTTSETKTDSSQNTAILASIALIAMQVSALALCLGIVVRKLILLNEHNEMIDQIEDRLYQAPGYNH